MGSFKSQIAIAVCLIAGSAAPVRAQIVDQSNTGPAPGSGSINAFPPYGQSFTPSLPGISFATFQIADFGSGSPGGTLDVEVHLGVDGTLLGTSQPDTLPPNSSFAGVDLQFTFSTPVILTPGQEYSLILVPLTGSFGGNQTGSNSYPGGEFIANGSEIANNDLYFIEGLSAVPEPGTLALTGVAVVGIWLRRRRNS